MSREAKILSQMQAYCVRAERCKFDIYKRLARYADELDTQAQTRIISSLIEDRFVDELRFASAYARDKYRFNGWGPRKIAMELKQRKIDDATIQSALDNLSRGDNALPDQLAELMQSKLRSIKAQTPYETYQKLMRWAVGRGFEYAHCKRIASELIDQIDIDE